MKFHSVLLFALTLTFSSAIPVPIGGGGNFLTVPKTLPPSTRPGFRAPGSPPPFRARPQGHPPTNPPPRIIISPPPRQPNTLNVPRPEPHLLRPAFMPPRQGGQPIPRPPPRVTQPQVQPQVQPQPIMNPPRIVVTPSQPGPNLLQVPKPPPHLSQPARQPNPIPVQNVQPGMGNPRIIVTPPQ